MTTGNYDSESCQIFHNVSVATWLNCRGIFIMTNLLISLIMKKKFKIGGHSGHISTHDGRQLVFALPCRYTVQCNLTDVCYRMLEAHSSDSTDTEHLRLYQPTEHEQRAVAWTMEPSMHRAHRTYTTRGGESCHLM